MEKRKQKSKECNPRRAGSVHNKKKKTPQMMSTATSQWWELIFFDVLWT